MRSATALNGTVASVELGSLLAGAAVSPVREIGWISVSGSDRVRWLNGMVTNSIQNLTPGAGCYNFILSAQGRIQGDAYAFMPSEEQILLRTDEAQVGSLTSLLDRFIIMDDVELGPGPDKWRGLQLAGPGASALLEQIGITAPARAPGTSSSSWRAGKVTTVLLHGPLVSRFELWADTELIEQVSEALRVTGAVSAGEVALEQLRLLEGTPRFSVDITDRELPQETAQTWALHFAKGCYLGQEIVERIRSRGAVHRTLTGFELTGTMPGPDRTLLFEDKKIGELTSWSEIGLPEEAGGDVRLALGYARREIIDKDVELTYVGGTARPVSLPYAPAQQYASKFLREGQHA